MCLAIPMKVKNIQGDFAKVEAGKFLRTVNIQMLPGLKTGDFIMVHAGFAIEKLSADKARQTLRMIKGDDLV
ncbi:MAG: HypC/HybG/HupF family hydrogenase formation chaperone [Candidatus Omnitrophica bacterium]|nr:HypC/HybG/HupF family hydrogenase formation chaperone [Candidatus Omnitrophota bacterium]